MLITCIKKKSVTMLKNKDDKAYAYLYHLFLFLALLYVL